MDHIGIDLHNKDSQMCILAEGGGCLGAGSVPIHLALPRCWASERRRASSSRPRRRASGSPGAWRPWATTSLWPTRTLPPGTPLAPAR